MVSLEEAIEQTGGFGRFQVLQCITQQFIMMSGSFSLYCMMYFELEPKYLCQVAGSEDWTACKSADFCDSDTPWEIDWSSRESLRNWVQEFDLVCAPKFDIGLLGSLFFAAVVLSSLVLPPLSDRVGRKPIVFFGGVL